MCIFPVTNTGDWVFDVEAEDGMKLIKYSHTRTISLYLYTKFVHVKR